MKEIGRAVCTLLTVYSVFTAGKAGANLVCYKDICQELRTTRRFIATPSQSISDWPIMNNIHEFPIHLLIFE